MVTLELEGAGVNELYSLGFIGHRDKFLSHG